MAIFADRQAGTTDSRVASQDPRLLPTPDYGTLGPDSDFARNSGGFSATPLASAPANRNNSLRAGAKARVLLALAMSLGIFAALVALVAGGPHGLINRTQGSPANQNATSAARASGQYLNRKAPQAEAEDLLTRAVSHSPGATEEIQSRVDGWRGRLNLDPQLSQLTTAALNSDTLPVRASGVEVQLAAYDLDKRSATVDRLLRSATSSDHGQKVWALWSLGLLGNRGIESDQVVEALAGHLEGATRDADEDSRHWAVEGLALVGTDATIAPLLRAMHDDPSPLVRERAACSLAESGMLTHQQRMTAVPRLIEFSDDPSLDAQTHTWAFQALSEITAQRLPHNAASWRDWYQSSLGNN